MDEKTVEMLNPMLQYGVVGLLVVVFAYIILHQYREKKKMIAEMKAERDELRQWKDAFYERQFKEYEDIIQNNTKAFYEHRSIMEQISDVLKELLKNGINK